MVMKRRPPLVAVLAVSVAALVGRTLWMMAPKVSATLMAVAWVPDGLGGGVDSDVPLAGDAVPFPKPALDVPLRRPPGGRPAVRAWEAPSPLSATQTQRRLAQSVAKPVEADLAYFVQVSPSNVALVPRLLAAVYHPDNVYAVHFDLKIEETVLTDTLNNIATALATEAAEDAPAAREQVGGMQGRQLKPVLPHNVLIMDRTHVTYRGITTVLNTLDGMSTLLNYTRSSPSPSAIADEMTTDEASRATSEDDHPPWTYFINLSAADYPLLSATATRRLLGRPDVVERHANFITFHPREEWAAATRNRYRRLVIDSGLSVLGARVATNAKARALTTTVNPTGVEHPLWANRVSRAPSPGTVAEAPAADEPPPVLLAKGGAWMIATRAFVTYATTSSDARRALVAMANGLSSSEHFFPTLLLEPAWRKSVLPHSMRAVYWDAEWSGGVPKELMQHPNTIDPVVPAERLATRETKRAAKRSAVAAADRATDGDDDSIVPPASAGPFGARVASSPYLFVRKFSRPDAPLLDWIDVHRLGRGRGGRRSAGMVTAEERAGRHLGWLLRLPPQQAVDA